MPLIKFGHTINNVSLENLESLLKVCKGKVLIDIKETDLKNIFLNSKRADLLGNCDLSSENNQYLFDLHKSKLTPLLFFILNNNNENLKATIKDSKTGEMVSFAQIAYNERDSELLDLLLSLNSKVFKAQMKQVVDRNSLTLRLINTIDFDIWVTLALNSDIFNPH